MQISKNWSFSLFYQVFNKFAGFGKLPPPPPQPPTNVYFQIFLKFCRKILRHIQWNLKMAKLRLKRSKIAGFHWFFELDFRNLLEPHRHANFQFFAQIFAKNLIKFNFLKKWQNFSIKIIKKLHVSVEFSTRILKNSLAWGVSPPTSPL